MTNAMPRFAVLKNKAFVGYVSAVSQAQARRRAFNLYGRCEVIHDVNGAKVDRKAQPFVDASYSHGRAPYPVGDFEARRKAEIAAWAARQ